MRGSSFAEQSFLKQLREGRLELVASSADLSYGLMPSAAALVADCLSRKFVMSCLASPAAPAVLCRIWVPLKSLSNLSHWAATIAMLSRRRRTLAQ